MLKGTKHTKATKKKQSIAARKRAPWTKVQKKAASERMLKLWSNKQKRKKRTESIRVATSENPTWRRKHARACRESSQRVEVREHHSKMMVKHWERPGRRQHQSTVMKGHWSDVEWKAEQVVGITKRARTPERRAAQSDLMIQLWKKPGHWEKVIPKLLAGGKFKNTRI